MIMGVGLVAAAFSAIRRKHDPILIYLAFLAGLYGLRMWIRTDLLSLTMQGSLWYSRVRYALDFLVAIPAFLFLDAVGFLHARLRKPAYGMGVVLGLLGLATLAVGPRTIFYEINAVLIIAALSTLVLTSMSRRSMNRDAVIIRRGLLIFAAFVFWENFRNLLGIALPNIEAIGFVAFLVALGYVAARQTLERDRQLSEIQKELEVARRIQLSILPAEFPASANFRVAARYVPMTSVAGDFYDFIVSDGQQAGLLIADVSGHGVPAALIASMVKVAANSQRAKAADPAQLLAGMNAVLFGNTQKQFVTAAYVHLDAASGIFRYSAAGHPAMLLLRGGEVKPILENGLMLAAFDFATYSNRAQPLEAGDRFLLYTDGLIEAANAKGNFFGQEALADLMRRTAELSASAASDRIISEMQRWAVSQDDDWTVLICDYSPSGLELSGATRGPL
jgi:sigma-B regulation protein RsbU (phosphoserine phosphatase)